MAPDYFIGLLTAFPIRRSGRTTCRRWPAGPPGCRRGSRSRDEAARGEIAPERFSSGKSMHIILFNSPICGAAIARSNPFFFKSASVSVTSWMICMVALELELLIIADIFHNPGLPSFRIFLVVMIPLINQPRSTSIRHLSSPRWIELLRSTLTSLPAMAP